MNAEEAQQKFKEADTLYKAGGYAEALTLLEELRAAFPGEKNVLHACILCLHALGQRDDALVAIGQLQALGDARANDLLKGLSAARRPSRGSVRPRILDMRLALIVGGLAIAGITLCAFVLISLKHKPSPAYPDMSQISMPASPSARATVEHTDEGVNAEPKMISPEKDDPHPRIVFPNPVFCTGDTWNLDREVARVMLDPRVPNVDDPKWKRESYQDIIDAAREARLNGRKTAIHVPGNITGKDTLKIAYLWDSRTSPNNDHRLIWGDDEDIVYVTSIHGFGGYGNYGVNPSATLSHTGNSDPSMGTHLQILAGTIVLFSALSADSAGGEMPPQLKDEFLRFYQIYKGEWTQDPHGYGKTTDKPENELYRMVRQERFKKYLPQLAVYGGLVQVRGSRESPVVMCSDAAAGQDTHCDWHSFSFTDGVADHLFTTGCLHTNGLTADTASTRSFPTKALESGRNGTGYVIANHFGECLNEHMTICPLLNWNGKDFGFVSYNVAAGVGMCTENVVVTCNWFFGESGIGGVTSPDRLVIKRNNFVRPLDNTGYGYFINVTDVAGKIDAQNNYWQSDFWRVTDDGGYARSKRILCQGNKLPTFDFSNPLSSPDSDLDGLTEDEERQLGTEPNKMDTDGDCLIDGLEVNEYHTDPLNWDTDGDGIPDGLEVYIKTDPKNKASFVPIGSSGDYFYDHVQLK